MIEKELNRILKKRFADGLVVITNQSHLHAGHSGSPETGESHFEVTIISDEFDQKSRLDRHKMVNELVFSLFNAGLHALNLNLFTTKEHKGNTF
jgi:BolA protein